MDLKISLVLLAAVICSTSEAFFLNFRTGQETYDGGNPCTSDYQCSANKCYERDELFCSIGSKRPLWTIKVPKWWEYNLYFQTSLEATKTANSPRVPNAQLTLIVDSVFIVSSPIATSIPLVDGLMFAQSDHDQLITAFAIHMWMSIIMASRPNKDHPDWQEID